MARTPRRVAYARWYMMIDRCTNLGNRMWPHYGGRGIKVCARWLNFETYYADTGDRPEPGMSVDRIDNDGDYEPSNVRWATSKQQVHNRAHVNQNQSKTACPEGHPYGFAKDGKRYCRQCKTALQRIYDARKRASRSGVDQ